MNSSRSFSDAKAEFEVVVTIWGVITGIFGLELGARTIIGGIEPDEDDEVDVLDNMGGLALVIGLGLTLEGDRSVRNAITYKLLNSVHTLL